MKRGLYIIVATNRCKDGHIEFLRRPAFRNSRSAPKGGMGRIVEVIGPPQVECGCCVSVIPSWTTDYDPRGYACRTDNLAPLEDPDAVPEEQPEEVEA